MKGFLKGSGGLFLLAPKVTTVGREGCDLVIQSSTIDQQHAMIEYLPDEGCFALQDLNSLHGTYVNDCRVENASVRLCPGDVLRFGKSSNKFELVVDQQAPVTYPPLYQQQQHSTWAQPLTLISDRTSPSEVMYQRGLPHLKTMVPTQAFTNTPYGTNGLPRPPASMRTRPLSAGSRRQFAERTPGIGVQNVHKNSAGWVRGVNRAPGLQRSSSITDLIELQEKEQKQMQLEEELRRLSAYQNECQQKDELIDHLYLEISQLHQQMQQSETRRPQSNTQDSDEVTRKLRVLEREVDDKKEEVKSLRNKINGMQFNENGNSTYRAEDVKAVTRLKEELLKSDQEKSSMAHYVAQLEQRLVDKNSDSGLLSKEIDSLTTKLFDKDEEIKSVLERLERMQGLEDGQEEKAEKLSFLDKRLQETEAFNEEQKKAIVSLQNELEEKTKNCEDSLRDLEKLEDERQKDRAAIDQMANEHQTRHNQFIENSFQFDEFRNQLKQIIASSSERPVGGDDEEILEIVKEIADEYLQHKTEVKNLIRKVSDGEQMLDSGRRLKLNLNEILTTLGINGFFSRELKLEIVAAKSKSYDCEYTTEMSDIFVLLLESQLHWENEIESALEEYGIDIHTSIEAPGKHVMELVMKLTLAGQELALLKGRLEESKELHKNDLEAALDGLKEDLEEKFNQTLKKAEIECKEKVAAAIRAEESVKTDDAVQRERIRVGQLEDEIRSLKHEIVEKKEQLDHHYSVGRTAADTIDSYKVLEDELRQKITELEKSFGDSKERFEKEFEEKVKGHRDEIYEHEEQIKQHALTICAMEERLSMATTKHKEYQTEISTLKSEISANQSTPSKQPIQPTPPPKPRAVLPAVDVVLLQQTLGQLQRENVEYAKQLQEQQDCITSLRRDLAGAMARLTDVSGELSESQKQEMEQYRAKVKGQEQELISSQQQLVKLSEIVDKQTTEIKGLNTEISKQKALLSKCKNRLNEKDARLKEVHEEISKSRTELPSQKRSVIDEETTISSELSLQGAQCRGERHEQVIARQREALAELRAKMRALEQADVPFLSQEEALQQVIILRQELDELRAIHSTRQQVDQTFGKMADCMDVTQISTLREISGAFELSENLYLSLLRGIASSLELENIEGMRSLLHLPKDERLRLVAERESSCMRLTDLVKALKERVHRKDELLQGYEKDLVKLRYAENLTEKTSGQVQSVMSDLRQKTEELQCLRESNRRTRDRLDQEKRLNAAIKQKKTFHLENEQVQRNGWPKHQCLRQDVQAELNAKKKLLNEKKRKNYERELKAKEAEISSHRQFLFGDSDPILELA